MRKKSFEGSAEIKIEQKVMGGTEVQPQQSNPPFFRKPMVARQPKIWISGGPSCEQAHHLWMSYSTNRTQTHMVWLSFGNATVTIWHLNTGQINWLGYLQCVCVCGWGCLCSSTNSMYNNRPNPTPFTQDAIQGLQSISPYCVFVCVCFLFTIQTTTIPSITDQLESNLKFLRASFLLACFHFVRTAF